MIPIKTEQELIIMQRAGKILARIMQKLKRAIRPGVSAWEIDCLAEKFIKDEGVESAFKGYKGYPANICISINNEVVHGIPYKDKLIKEQDLVSLDLGINYKGYFVDMALTIGVGKINPLFKKLIKVTKRALFLGIKQAKEGNFLGDISWTIQNYVEKEGFSVVKQYTGHGIGKELHEEPEVPNFGFRGTGPVLKRGMVLAIEPMVNVGRSEVKVSSDSWTVVTLDGTVSCHFEHTVAITKRGPRILTL